MNQVINPLYNNQSLNRAIKQRGRDLAIQNAYDQIVLLISHKVEPDCNRARHKFIHLQYPDEVQGKSFIKQFTCPYCEVMLSLRDNEYIITLTVTANHLQAGAGVNTNALLRIAFKVTGYEHNGYIIEDRLDIRMAGNMKAIYQYRFDNYHHLKEQQRMAQLKK